MRWRVTDRFWITPNYWYQNTPTYRQSTVGCFFRYRFGTLENMGVNLKKEKDDLL